jgi:hypothetical protein
VSDRLCTADGPGLSISAATSPSASNVRRARDKDHVPGRIGNLSAGNERFGSSIGRWVRRARRGRDDNSANREKM